MQRQAMINMATIVGGTGEKNVGTMKSFSPAYHATRKTLIETKAASRNVRREAMTTRLF